MHDARTAYMVAEMVNTYLKCDAYAQNIQVHSSAVCQRQATLHTTRKQFIFNENKRAKKKETTQPHM